MRLKGVHSPLDGENHMLFHLNFFFFFVNLVLIVFKHVSMILLQSSTNKKFTFFFNKVIKNVGVASETFIC